LLWRFLGLSLDGFLLSSLCLDLIKSSLGLSSLPDLLLWVNWTELLIFILLEVKLLLRDLSVVHSLLVISLLLSVDKESLLLLLFGGFHGLSSLDSVIILIIRVSEVILDVLLLLLLWYILWQFAAGLLLSPLNRLLSISDLLGIILENLWSFSSLGLLELLLWGQILHFDLWFSERSVNRIRLDHGNSWNWVVISWNGKHNVVSNTGGLGESLTILVEVKLGVVVKRGVNSLGIGLNLLSHLFLSLVDALVGLLLLSQVLVQIIKISLKELNV